MPDLLLEIGTEELPPFSLQSLSNSFRDSFASLLQDYNLSYKQIDNYCTPRRLTLIVKDLTDKQPDSEHFHKGPAEKVALDSEGKPSKALLGFAKSCQVNVEDLEKISTEKGVWFGATIKTKGKRTIDLIPDIFRQSLNKLPIAKRMRWGELSDEFVRPVHWICSVFGSEVVAICQFGISSSNLSYGHKFHAPKAIKVTAANYVAQLKSAQVIVDIEQRKQIIKSQVVELANKLGGNVKYTPEFITEVSSLVEYPVALAGKFDQEFLQVPPEAIVAFMEGHQKFFAVFDQNDKLLPFFITVANIKSKNPAVVISGNERVIRPRLSDALFFWQQDLKLDFKQQYQKLASVIYQQKLGTIQDKVKRVKEIACYLAECLKQKPDDIEQLVSLAKLDLLSQMVAEFPKLQGTMGKYYALNSGVKQDIAQAIEEHYLPKYADDILPSTKLGQILAISDRIDTIVGIFGIGLKPSGDKDPFGLRRASLAILRIIIECKLELNLPQLINKTTNLLATRIKPDNQVLPFMMERLKGLCQDPHIFPALYLAQNGSVLDFIKREQAVIEFSKSKVCDKLIAANKRIDNLLKKSSTHMSNINPDLFSEPEEINLYHELQKVQAKVIQLTESGEYVKAFEKLSSLAPRIDDFFDNVLVISDDNQVKQNRLAMLATIRKLFLKIADLSKIIKPV